MELGPEVFAFDLEATVGGLEDFIAGKLREFGRRGVVVPISGGLDSSVVAALCARAVGPDRVTGLMLPERQGNPDARRYALLLARSLGVAAARVSITLPLLGLGAYGFVLSWFPTRALREALARRFTGGDYRRDFLDGLRGSESRLVRKAMASIASKQRTRAVALYKYAEERNLLVVGAAHLTEDLLGLYVKFGVDDVADLMPLRNFFRAQILALALHLGLPAEITGRSPNPDIVPGVSDKYRSLLGFPVETADLALYGLLHGMEEAEIASRLGIPASVVDELRELMRLSWHMRNPSLAPEGLPR